MTPLKAAVAGGLLGLLVLIVAILSLQQRQIASTDRVPNSAFVTVVDPASRLCQKNEVLPAGANALRMTIGTYGKPGPALRLVIAAPPAGAPNARAVMVSSSRIAAGWRQGVVTMAIPRVTETRGGADVCITDAGRVPVAVAGVTPPASYGYADKLDGQQLGSEVRIDYMLPGRPSWFSMLTTLAYRMTLGKGTYVGWMGWIGPLLAMLAAVALIVGVLLRPDRGRTARVRQAATASHRRLARSLALIADALARPPPLAYWCALIGALNAFAWGIIMPPFEVPDENAHYAYVQQLVEARALPHQQALYTGLSPREDKILGVIHAFEVPGQADNPAPLTSIEQQQLESVEHQQLSALGSGDALSAAPNPPLYYALEAIPYAISPSHSVLNRLALMRVLSAIFAGLTVFFAFMFLRELLPGTPWVWPVGALAVALQPLFASISGGLNNDALLYTFAAAAFFAIARMFRRGLDERTGLALGAVFGAGLLAKYTLLGFAPAAALAVAWGLWRARRSAPRAALRGAGIAAAVAVLPTFIYLEVANRTVTSSGVGPAGPGFSMVGLPTGLRGELDHVWQLFLPTIPGLGPNQFANIELWHEWFYGLIGRFGWLDTTFPYWVYLLVASIALLLLAAAIATLARERRRLTRHLVELIVYVGMIAGLCFEVGVESYQSLVTDAGIFEQPRYMLSGLCVYAAIVALAARLPGRRFGIVVGALIVILALAHDVVSQMQVIARYYA